MIESSSVSNPRVMPRRLFTLLAIGLAALSPGRGRAHPLRIEALYHSWRRWAVYPVVDTRSRQIARGVFRWKRYQGDPHLERIYQEARAHGLCVSTGDWLPFDHPPGFSTYYLHHALVRIEEYEDYLASVRLVQELGDPWSRAADSMRASIMLGEVGASARRRLILIKRPERLLSRFDEDRVFGSLSALALDQRDKLVRETAIRFREELIEKLANAGIANDRFPFFFFTIRPPNRGRNQLLPPQAMVWGFKGFFRSKDSPNKIRERYLSAPLTSWESD